MFRGNLHIEKPKPRTLLTTVMAGLILVGIPFTDAAITKNKVYPGVRVGDLELGGKDLTTAQQHLQKYLEDFRAKEVTFSLEGVKTSFRLGNLITFDEREIFTQAQKVGHAPDSWVNLKRRAQARAQGILIIPKVTVHTETLNKLLSEAYVAKEQPPQDAQFLFDFSKKDAPVITITEGRPGIVIDKEEAGARLIHYGQTFNRSPIELIFKNAEPLINRADLEALSTAVQAQLVKTLLITADKKSWKLDPAIYASWIQPIKLDGVLAMDFSQDGITAWLDKIATEIERAPINALFALSPDEKRVEKFELGKNGVRLPRSENAELISKALKDGLEQITLTVNTTPPEITSAALAQQYGIRELVGRGTTEFKGSPPNRVKNIKRGADLLNGILIAPGEEFSLLDRLRPFTLENGYLPELVIKAAEGRTTPEIGGGLCQIGTTMFRTVLNAGLPITARQNHSYRVSYYEPPVGMDATIYDPAPDFKFINDTENWLLLTTFVDTKAMRITFDLWGTKDNRTVLISKPEISNLKKPLEKKIVETTDLAPGKIKCTEKAHVGSDARFTYTVTYPDGRVVEKEFKSRYRPWQEVCLVGVEKKEEPAPGPTTPTPSDTTTVPSADTLGVIGEENPTLPQQSTPQN